jgi:mannose-6-phosphate isomerase-like protein (cupin superfamily)
MPACDFLAAAVGAAAAGPTVRIVAALAPLLDDLRWSYGYPVDPKWPDLGSRVAFAQLVGSRGLTDDDFVNLGLTLMAPRTHYPLHAHPAIEVYLVLSGTAGWRIQGQPFRTQPPGSLLLHRSGIGHAMLTNAEPLLALYVWRGDLATAPIYVEDT